MISLTTYEFPWFKREIWEAGKNINWVLMTAEMFGSVVNSKFTKNSSRLDHLKLSYESWWRLKADFCQDVRRSGDICKIIWRCPRYNRHFLLLRVLMQMKWSNILSTEDTFPCAVLISNWLDYSSLLWITFHFLIFMPGNRWWIIARFAGLMGSIFSPSLSEHNTQ